MNRFEKTIFVSILTVFLLAFSNFLTTGKFIFTFPLNDYIFLFISLYFSFLLYKSEKTASIFLVFFGIFNLLGKIYNYEYFLNQEQLTRISNSSITDIFELLTYLSYFAINFIFVRQAKNIISWLMLFSQHVLLVVSSSFEAFFLNLFASFLIIPIFLSFNIETKQRFKEFFLILIFFSILLATKIITLYII